MIITTAKELRNVLIGLPPKTLIEITETGVTVFTGTVRLKRKVVNRIDVMDLHDQGLTNAQIAAKFGVSHTAIHQIVAQEILRAGLRLKTNDIQSVTP